MHFPFATFSGIAVFILGLIGIGLTLFVPSREDVQSYHQLMVESSSKEHDQKEDYKAIQKRIGMHKQIFHYDGDSRLEIRLGSAKSELVLERENEEIVIVENMEDLKCYIQEKFIKKSTAEPRQQILVLTSDKASYDYKKEKLITDKIKIARYDIPGVILTEDLENFKPILSGEAESAEFDLKGSHFNFKSNQFKAKIQS